MRINEIFASIQGEGHFTGTPSVFIRTSRCNLHCPFCDTLHEAGEEMAVGDIIRQAVAFEPRHAVVTGGEPALQPQLPMLVDALHKAGFYVQIETNGTLPLPDTIDWITCSPKMIDKTVILAPHELKVVYEGQDMQSYERAFRPRVWSLQPCDTKDAERNRQLISAAVSYIMEHPQWRLSLQTHKLIGVR